MNILSSKLFGRLILAANTDIKVLPTIRISRRLTRHYTTVLIISENFILSAMEITTMSQALQFHAQVLKSGKNHQKYAKNITKLFTFSALSPSGNLTYARHILNSLQTPNSYYYNTMIRAYSDCPDPYQAFTLFLTMHQQLGNYIPLPDKFTYPFVLKACSKLRQTHFGKQLHALLYKAGLLSDRYILNVLVYMYSGCGELALAWKVFDKMSERDVVSWTSIINGFVDNDRPLEALNLFEQMMEDGEDLNDVTVVSVLRACADSGALSVGERVNEIVKGKKLYSQSNVSTALIDMYAKCGCVDKAMQVFDETVDKNVFIWTAMISGLAIHQRCKEAIDMFEKMKSFGVKPDDRTMTAVLSACRNAGWVNKGLTYIKNMTRVYKLKPTIQHYGCIVDLLARTGRLNDAEEFIKTIPLKPDAVLCRSLIWACKFHGDIERGERLMRNLQFLNTVSNDCGSYVLLSNLYASVGKWQDKAKVRESMYKNGFVKPPGFSRIEINGLVHEFKAGDSGHHEAQCIYEKLDEIKERLRNEGYSPKLSETLLEIGDDERESQLLHHSEKLAVSFGLIKTKPGNNIRIVKNLRSCEDCHSFMKLISKIYQRQIIIKDRTIFHSFNNGECSCGDFW